MTIRGIIPVMLFVFLSVSVLEFINNINHGYSDNPEEVDVIVLLGGGDEGRMMKAAELYEDGYADYVMITPVIESDASAQTVQAAMRYGIPESQLILERDATSTYTNSTRTMEVMGEYGLSSALIVTSDYLIKRSELIYDRENDGSFSFKYIASLSACRERWYGRGNTFRIWRSEFVKMWGYRVGGYRFFEFGV